MKQPRTLQILRLMTSSVRAVLKNEPHILDQQSTQLEELGGIYIKFMQWIVLGLDPEDQTMYRELLRVYENSKPDVMDVGHYLGSRLSQAELAKFKSIESTPFATGSFGQVYRAELRDGQSVIIKVLRPSVARYLGYDLRLLGFLSRLYSLFDRQKMLNFRAIYKDFKKTCLQETNYIREAHTAHSYAQNYVNHPNLVIPKTYLELCRPTILVQDYVQGMSLTKLLELQSIGMNAQDVCRQYLQSDLYFQLKVVGVELFSKALIGQPVQTDPHPGNILLLPNNQVALIDFGMATTVRTNRQALYELMLQYQAFYSGNLAIDKFTTATLKCMAPELYEAIIQADKLFVGSDLYGVSMLDKLSEMIKEIFNDQEARPALEQMLERKMIMKVMFFAINKGNRFGFSFDLDTTSLWKAIHTYFITVARFDASGQHVVLPVFNETIALSQQHLDQIFSSPTTTMNPDQALETLSRWFDKMSRNDPWLMDRVAGNYLL